MFALINTYLRLARNYYRVSKYVCLLKQWFHVLVLVKMLNLNKKEINYPLIWSVNDSLQIVLLVHIVSYNYICYL